MRSEGPRENDPFWQILDCCLIKKYHELLRMEIDELTEWVRLSCVCIAGVYVCGCLENPKGFPLCS